MKYATIVSALLVGVAIACFRFQPAEAESAKDLPPNSVSSNSPEAKMSHEALFKKMVGKWKGSVRTWFEPGKLADESEITGEIAPLLGGGFLRHTYSGSIKGKPRTGEEMIGYNGVTNKFQSSWADSFYMNYALMWSEGDARKNGFSVFGKYDIGPGRPPWGWRTEYALVDDNRLVITAYNVTPDGEEAKAVEAKYERISAE